MLKKYTQFITESIELLLESNVVYSPKFRKALNKIQDPIAKTLLSIENKDLDVQSNYFDIPIDKNDTVTFIPDKRAQEILGDKKELVRFTGRKGGWLTHNMEQNAGLFAQLGFEPKQEEVYKPKNDEIGQVMGKVIGPKSGRTYFYVKFPKGEGVYNSEKLVPAGEDLTKLVWSKNRQEVRVGRAVRALLTSSGQTEILDKDIESFVNSFRAVIDIMNDVFSHFEIIRGEKIGWWYDNKNYKEIKGTLGNSCMAGGPKRWFDVYCSNPDTIGLLILKSEADENKLMGRALLWKLDDGSMFLDRIYTAKDSDVTLFREYAKSKGWYTRSDNGYSAQNSASGGKVDLTAHIKPGKYKGYAYMDTFTCWDPKTGKISANEFKGSKHMYNEEYGGGDDDGDDECITCGGTGDVSCTACKGKGTLICKCVEGKVKCKECKKGKIDCQECKGKGTKKGEPCTSCEEGKINCPACGGTNEVPCKKCDGKGGERKCKKCGGEGHYDCPDCN